MGIEDIEKALLRFHLNEFAKALREDNLPVETMRLDAIYYGKITIGPDYSVSIQQIYPKGREEYP